MYQERKRKLKKLTPTEIEAISTTTSLGRVRGFTVDLLHNLNEGPTRCRDLAQISDKTWLYVRSYLRRMRFYGLVEKYGSFWVLTDLAMVFLSYLDMVNMSINKYKQKHNRNKTKTIHKPNTSKTKKPKQVAILPFLHDLDLDGTEREVVEVLVEHYDKTGSKFILVRSQFELAEKLGKNPQDIMEAFKNLRQDNIIYVMKSKEFDGTWKIGLKKAWVEGLKKGAES